MEYEELSDEVKTLIDKEADARCKFKMEQFFESIKNILHIYESAPDPYAQQTANHLRDDQEIILERYRKEMEMNVPFDNIIIENRQDFKRHTESTFNKLYNQTLLGRIDSRRVESIRRFIAEHIETAFDLDSKPSSIDFTPYTRSLRYRLQIHPTKQIDII